MTWAIECACLVCHGPLVRGARGPAGLTCGNACRLVLMRLRRGGALADRYVFLRWTHAYRRERLAALAWVTARIPATKEAA